MLHVKVRRSLNFHFGAFTVLVFHTVVFLTLIHSCTGQHQVIGPSQPIVATVGGDIIFPCHLEPAMDASDMTVEWTRPDLDPRFVFVWRDGFELESKKHPSYEGRTSLFINELKLGNISLKLSKVKISDEGRYRCFIPGFRESTVQLVVGAASSPVIQMTKNSSGVDLRCESQGWYPKPEVLWLDGEGNLLSAGPTETVRGPDGLYTVSSRVTVEKRHSNSFTCRVQQKNINQTRETHIHVPDDFFPGPSSSSSSATIIGLVVGILFILAVVFVVWKWRQNRIRNKKHHEDEERQKVREKKRNSTSNNSEQESLMDREPDREPLTAERETVNDLDQFKEETGLETQTDNETRQRESNNVQCAVNKGTELQFSVEGGRQTDQRLAEGETENGLDKSEEETETKPINERRDAPNPAARETESDLSNKEDETKSVSDNTEQPTGERQTENNLQTEEGEEEIKSTGDKTQVQCLMEEEEHGEQLTAERETPNDLDKEKETRVRKLKTKEREQKELKKKVSRLEEQMKQKEEQIKQLKLQLEEVERQREETQRKIHSVNMEEDEEEAAEEQKDEDVKRLLDTMNDLERRKAELQKQLQKRETQLERMKKDKMIRTEGIMRLTLSREKTENHSDSEDL